MILVDFNLTNYEFRIVKMEVFNESHNLKQNQMTYYLLVDANNFIHDYKFQFHKLIITPQTTESHNKPSLDKRLLQRLQMLKILNIKHTFSEHKEAIEISDQDLLEKLNKWIWKENWNNFTFQNIEYLIKGSNPLGQGSAKGYLKTDYHGISYCFGFFFQMLNIGNAILKKYNNVSYDSVWYEYFNNKNITEVDFDKWMEKSDISNFFKEYVLNSKNWKNINDRFKIHLNKLRQDFMKLEDEISRLRNKYRNDINKRFQQSGNIINHFFEQADTTSCEYAHIKPVYQIRNEYLKTNDQEVLNQIADTNNFLPLSPNVHTLYDKKYFYWTKHGELIDIKEFINKDILGFSKIRSEVILDIEKYLNDYESIL